MVRRLFGSLVHWSIGPLPLRAVEPQNRRTVGLNLPRCGVHAVMVTFSDAKTLLVLAKAKSPAVTRRLTSLFVETTFTPFIFKPLKKASAKSSPSTSKSAVACSKVVPSSGFAIQAFPRVSPFHRPGFRLIAGDCFAAAATFPPARPALGASTFLAICNPSSG